MKKGPRFQKEARPLGLFVRRISAVAARASQSSAVRRRRKEVESCFPAACTSENTPLRPQACALKGRATQRTASPLKNARIFEKQRVEPVRHAVKKTKRGGGSSGDSGPAPPRRRRAGRTAGRRPPGHSGRCRPGRRPGERRTPPPPRRPGTRTRCH